MILKWLTAATARRKGAGLGSDPDRLVHEIERQLLAHRRACRVRRLAPYALLTLGAVLCGLTYRMQGAELVASSLVLCAGIMWCLERHGY